MITLLSGCRGNEMVPGTTHTGTRNVSVYIPDTTQITREKTGNCNVCRNVSPNLPLGPNSTTMKYKHPGEKREGRTLFTTEQLVNIPK